jgi:AcrR family transcriptional regulator
MSKISSSPHQPSSPDPLKTNAASTRNTHSHANSISNHGERIDTRQKILSAARELFVRRGYEATTMRAIAEQIEYTPTAIYHHFQNKETLLTELAVFDFRSLAAALLRIGQVADPIERLRRMGVAYVEFGITHPMQYQFMFMTSRPADARSEIAHGDPGEDAYAFLRQTCIEVIATGRLRPEFQDPEEVAQMAWAAMHGLVALQIAKGDDEAIPWQDVRETAASSCDTLVRGLLR